MIKCAIHNVPLVCFCPVCRGLAGGSKTSKAKSAASRANGRLGGRPKKDKTAKSKS